MGDVWKLRRFDPFDGEWYDLPGDWPTKAEAVKAGQEKLAEQERLNPTSTSGGQRAEGIQDRIYLVRPDGTKYRLMPE